MVTVSQAMNSFISNLELADKERENAKRQRNEIRKHLEKGLSVKEFLLSGSFKRRTAIFPLNDIDLFVVLDEIAHEDLKELAPIQTLKKIQKILNEAYPTKKEHPIIQSRSVNIEFVGTGLAFDVVPAFPDADDKYVIPDRDIDDWIKTNPRAHSTHSTEANERTGKMAKPLVKALKCWNRQYEPKVLRSFHLELMVCDVLKSKPDSCAEGLADLFHNLEVRVQSAMPEPAGIGPNVDSRMTDKDRKRAQDLFYDAAKEADKALKYAKEGYTGEAHFVWRQLFGNQYPEKGTAPKGRAKASSVVVGSGIATDAPGRRFG